MSVGGLWMSARERERCHLVRQSVEGVLGQREASERLGIGVRQFKRLVRRWREAGDAGLVSRRRGRVAPGPRPIGWMRRSASR
jgi:transposase